MIFMAQANIMYIHIYLYTNRYVYITTPSFWTWPKW